jgi:hypothetical protein
MSRESQVSACDLTALPPGGKERLAALSEDLFGRAQEARSLPDGFELGYRQASAGTIAQLAEFIALDRLCCPFIRHGLFVEPDAGSSGRATSRGQTQRCCPGDPRLRLPVAPQRAPGTSNSEAVAHLAVL